MAWVRVHLTGLWCTGSTQHRQHVTSHRHLTRTRFILFKSSIITFYFSSSFPLVAFSHALKCSCSVGCFVTQRGAGAEVLAPFAHARNRSRMAAEVYRLKHYFSYSLYAAWIDIYRPLCHSLWCVVARLRLYGCGCLPIVDRFFIECCNTVSVNVLAYWLMFILKLINEEKKRICNLNFELRFYTLCIRTYNNNET